MTAPRFNPIPLTRPGLFIAATDTGVGKTAVACGIARLLRQAGHKVGVCKPLASGCRFERETLISPDGEALAHFADAPQPLATITPVRYRQPLSPGAAAEATGRPIDDEAIAHALSRLDTESDRLLVEGIGGVMVPLDQDRNVLDLAVALGYPVLVVTRPDLGTLNHTALTCAAVRQVGLKLAGLVVNRYKPESTDPSVATNPRWLARQNQTDILATVPDAEGCAPEQGQLPPAVLEALDAVDWSTICRPQAR